MNLCRRSLWMLLMMLVWGAGPVNASWDIDRWVLRAPSITFQPTPAAPTLDTGESFGVESASASSEDSPGSPFSDDRLFVDPDHPARATIRAWVRTRPDDAQALGRIARTPSARWFGIRTKNIRQSLRSYTRAAGAAIPVVVLDAVPGRVCGPYSAPAARSDKAYRRWIGEVVRGLRRSRAIVILEPHALTRWDCMDVVDRQARARLLRWTVDQLQATRARVYMDAGHSTLHGAEDMIGRLQQAGIDRADGFVLNIGATRPVDELVQYGETISDGVGGARFILDTSRSGAGSSEEWCNPQDVRLGPTPTLRPLYDRVDALLWIHRPGYSDGTCQGGPRAGVWWPPYALRLTRTVG